VTFASLSGQFSPDDNSNDGGLFGKAAPREFPSYTLYGGSTMRLPEVFAAASLTARVVGKRGSSSSNTLLNDRTSYTLASYATLDAALTSLDVFIFRERETHFTVAIHNLTNNQYVQPGHGGFDLPNVGRQYFFRLSQEL